MDGHALEENILSHKDKSVEGISTIPISTKEGKNFVGSLSIGHILDSFFQVPNYFCTWVLSDLLRIKVD